MRICCWWISDADNCYSPTQKSPQHSNSNPHLCSQNSNTSSPAKNTPLTVHQSHNTELGIISKITYINQLRYNVYECIMEGKAFCHIEN